MFSTHSLEAFAGSTVLNRRTGQCYLAVAMPRQRKNPASPASEELIAPADEVIQSARAVVEQFREFRDRSQRSTAPTKTIESTIWLLVPRCPHASPPRC